jgi:hypothetical protein
MYRATRIQGMSREDFYTPDSDCLRKHNYSTGAGWKASKRCKHPLDFSIKSKKRGSIYGLRRRIY